MIGVLHDDLETLNPLNPEPYTLDHNKTELNLAGHPQATNNFDGHYDRLALGLSKSPGLFLVYELPDGACATSHHHGTKESFVNFLVWASNGSETS